MSPNKTKPGANTTPGKPTGAPVTSPAVQK